MVGDRYDAENDPACYPGSLVLRSIRDLREQMELDTFEVEAVGGRSLQSPPPGYFDPTHYCDIHRHLFQDVYEWAGVYRTIRTGKGGNWFCYPEYIDAEMVKLFGKLNGHAFQLGSDVEIFVAAVADFLSDLNAIHPFREGNGRTQLLFVRLLGQRAGHPFRSENIEADAFLHAMILSFNGKIDALIDELERMLA